MVNQLLVLFKSALKEAYEKGFTDGRVKTAKAMIALDKLEDKLNESS